MKKYLTFIIILFLILISSCAKQASSDPADAAFRYLTALADKDKASLINLSCKSWEEGATLEADALLSVGAALNNVSCQVVGEDGDLQLVTCTGKLDLTYGEEVRSIDLGLRTYSMGFEEGQWRVCEYN